MDIEYTKPHYDKNGYWNELHTWTAVVPLHDLHIMLTQDHMKEWEIDYSTEKDVSVRVTRGEELLATYEYGQSGHEWRNAQHFPCVPIDGVAELRQQFIQQIQDERKAEKAKQKPVDRVVCPHCHASVHPNQLMSASLGRACINCYDDMSD